MHIVVGVSNYALKEMPQAYVLSPPFYSTYHITLFFTQLIVKLYAYSGGGIELRAQGDAPSV
jgi:hypothetical protein